MKRWSVKYEGKMLHQTNKTAHHVKLQVSYWNGNMSDNHYLPSCFQAEYSSKFPYFDFDSDMDPWTVARAFAKEPWSREYFDRIQK